LDGKRVRKNFATRTEAVTERQLLEIALVSGLLNPHGPPARVSDAVLEGRRKP
jgi:hypothetical protein